MTPEPLSARLLQMADDLKTLAHLASTLNPNLGTALICHAARTALASVAAEAEERELRRLQRALEELHENAREEAAQAMAAANPAHQAIIDGIKASLPRLIG
jgi:hypothetical protein